MKPDSEIWPPKWFEHGLRSFVMSDLRCIYDEFDQECTTKCVIDSSSAVASMTKSNKDQQAETELGKTATTQSNKDCQVESSDLSTDPTIITNNNFSL